MRDSEVEVTVALGRLVLAFGEGMPTDTQLAALKLYSAAVREDEKARCEAAVLDAKEGREGYLHSVIEAIRNA